MMALSALAHAYLEGAADPQDESQSGLNRFTKGGVILTYNLEGITSRELMVCSQHLETLCALFAQGSPLLVIWRYLSYSPKRNQNKSCNAA